ncbi:MAG TPA: energy transducer TonB [Candidatus Polarisedimenticolaceae bacterium]|nr:energy transducer TonB [Candidatus Polarisedimenticolaceae bacterium]
MELLEAEPATCPDVGLPTIVFCGSVRDASDPALERVRATIDATFESAVSTRPWETRDGRRERLYELDDVPVAVAIDPRTGTVQLSYPQQFRRCSQERIAAVGVLGRPKKLPKPEPDVSLPKLRGKQVRPVYPELPRRARMEGHVELLASISKEGSVTEVCIARPSRTPKVGFEVAAMRAVEQWQYKPAIKDGEPVDVPSFFIAVDFILE